MHIERSSASSSGLLPSLVGSAYMHSSETLTAAIRWDRRSLVLPYYSLVDNTNQAANVVTLGIQPRPAEMRP